ncbi:MAG: PEP-CTERM sorting domain-containing protein [Pirellulaceae bacterium]|nr:PEP-CTERM sorting domain-containing protein [Pirellulaceae bacterium]
MWIVVGSIALATPNRAQADFVFNITQRDVGAPISVGSETIFDVTVARGPNLPSVDNLAGISFFVGLGDPANWGGTHPAGVLRSGTNDSSSPLAGGRNYLFGPADGGGFLNDNADFLAFSVSTTIGRTLSTTPSYLGTFVLDSLNGTPGDYALMFAPNEFGVQDPSSNFLPGTYSGASFNFTMITAIPEPSSWLLFTTAAILLGLLSRKRIIGQSSAPAA